MTAFTNRNGTVVAVFKHYGDAIQFEQQNLRHGYDKRDEPNLEQVIAEAVDAPLVDAEWRKPQISG